jgi:hypothetical protein
MPMSEKKVLIIVAAVLVGVVIYYKWCDSKPNPIQNKREGYLAAGGMQHLGTILPDGALGDYEIIESNVDRAKSYPSLDDSLKISDYAELVDSGDQGIQTATFVDASRPLERLQNLTDSYFPTIASKALPFSQAAAKPLYHHHAVNLPRVNLKGKLYEMNLSEAVRGSIPINYDPNISVISTSQYKVEDAFNPGYMTTAFNSLHDKLTGGYKNLPMYLAGAGQATGIAGNGVEAIYDAY